MKYLSPHKKHVTHIVFVVGTCVYISYVDVCKSHWGFCVLYTKDPRNSYTHI